MMALVAGVEAIETEQRARGAEPLARRRVVIASHGPSYYTLREEISVGVDSVGEQLLEVHEHSLDRQPSVAFGARKCSHQRLEGRRDPSASEMRVR